MAHGTDTCTAQPSSAKTNCYKAVMNDLVDVREVLLNGLPGYFRLTDDGGVITV